METTGMSDDTLAQAAADAVQGGVALVENPSVEEVLAARSAASTTAIAHAELPEGHIAIFDPEHESLVYGQSGEIKFGPRGGFEPHVWVGPEDLGAEDESNIVGKMLLAHPQMVVVGQKANQVFVCGDCAVQGKEAEFKSLASFRGHKLAKHGGTTKQ